MGVRQIQELRGFFSRWDVFETHDVKRVKNCNVSLPIRDGEGRFTNQDELRVRHRIRISIRGKDRKRPESATHPFAYFIKIHTVSTNSKC